MVTEKGGVKKSRNFDYVVLASGSFTMPNLPDIKVRVNCRLQVV